ncbi:Matrixin-domain-containing protein [Trichophaea hybrida]|nr:Matrixin-domain-containing protein [Trichophaea hybrida]
MAQVAYCDNGESPKNALTDKNTLSTTAISPKTIPALLALSIKRAFDTWANAGVGLTFTEVTADGNPDIFIKWRQANDPDHSMVGNVLAHADFPPGFSIILNGIPLPLHFDDQEHPWVDGAVAGSFDIETVGLHEIGHVLGLYHSDVVSSIMFASVSSKLTKRTLTPDDLKAVRNLYPPESGSASNLIGGTGLTIESSVSVSGGGAPVTWKFLGGSFEGEPAVVSMFKGRLDVFVRGNDSQVYHKSYREGQAGVAAESTFFGRRFDNIVNRRAWTGSSWSEWENLGGQPCIGNICVTTGGGNNLHVFIRRMDNGVHHKSFDGSWASEWENVGGKILGQPSAVSWGDSHSAGVDRVDVFVRGTDNGAYQKTWTGAVWEPAGTGWRKLGGTIMGDIVPVVSSPTTIDIFVLGTNNAVSKRPLTKPNGCPPILIGPVSAALLCRTLQRRLGAAIALRFSVRELIMPCGRIPMSRSGSQGSHCCR